MKKYLLLPFILSFLWLWVNCGNSQSKSPIRFDPEPVRQLALYEAQNADPYLYQKIDRILKNPRVKTIPALALTARCFSWSAGMTGPFTRILNYCRDTGVFFQRSFLYYGEYEISSMRHTGDYLPQRASHPLGIQLSQLALDLGPDVYLNPERLQLLLDSTMVGLLGCRKIRKDEIAEMDVRPEAFPSKNPLTGESLGIHFSRDMAITFSKIKDKLCLHPDPHVSYYYGELTFGIWEATIRRLGDTGRYCIELEYLNGDYAYTVWI